MKIEKIIFQDAGPLKNITIDFTDEWTGIIADKILFSGPNGSGKSFILRAIAMLWDAAGYWLDMSQVLPIPRNSVRSWLRKWGGIAMILQDMPACIGLFYGYEKWFETVRATHPDVNWIGEIRYADAQGSRK